MERKKKLSGGEGGRWVGGEEWWVQLEIDNGGGGKEKIEGIVENEFFP